MSRPAIRELGSRPFELVVIGAGIHGAFAALEAARRGYRVALIDSGDFGASTSANSMRVLHGGFRYLQRMDVRRLRESARESAYLMDAAPHLTAPLPCTAPIGVGGMPRGAAFRAAFLAQAVLAPRSRADRRGGSRVVGSAEYTRLCGEFAVPGANGGAVWYDGFMGGAERLLMNVVRTACAHGAIAANYVACEALIVRDGVLRGVRVRDVESGARLDLRADRVINAAGVSAPHVLGGVEAMPQARFARGCNVIVRRAPPSCAVAVPIEAGRMLFAVPFGGSTMLGTWYSSAEWPTRRSGLDVSSDVKALLGAFREALPGMDIDISEVTRIHAGYLPLDPDLPTGDVVAALRERPLLVDHGSSGGVRGVISLIGVKWTTARAAALLAVRMATRPLVRIPKRVPPDEPLYGGPRGPETPRGSVHLAEADRISELARMHLAAIYGSGARDIVRSAQKRADLLTPLAAGEPTIGAEVVHAIRSEHALHLTDVLLRRALVGLTARPVPELVEGAAKVAAAELDWNESRTADEIAAVYAEYPAAP